MNRVIITLLIGIMLIGIVIGAGAIIPKGQILPDIIYTGLTEANINEYSVSELTCDDFECTFTISISEKLFHVPRHYTKYTMTETGYELSRELYNDDQLLELRDGMINQYLEQTYGTAPVDNGATTTVGAEELITIGKGGGGGIILQP